MCMDEIEKIDREIKEASAKVHELQKERYKLVLMKVGLIGKYLYCPRYGYMFVISQNVKDCIILNGFTFKHLFTDYFDDCYFGFNALGRWELSFQEYKNLMKDRELIELSKEQFYEALYNALDLLKEQSLKILHCQIEDVQTNN